MPGKREQSTAGSTKAGGSSSRLPGRARWVVYALILVLALALVMDLVFYTGFYASDDLKHIHGAVQLAESGRMTTINTATIRPVLLLPLALVVKVTHYNLFAMTAFFALFHLLLILATYSVGRLVHDCAVGVLAAGLAAVCPVAVYNATLILPDHAVTALVLSSIGILLLARQRMYRTPPATRSACALSAAAGFVFGLAFGAKLSAIFMIPVFAILILSWLRKRPLVSVMKSGIWFAVGTAAAVVSLSLVFHAMTGLYSPLQSSHFAGLIETIPERVAAKGYPTFSDRLERSTQLARSEKYLGLFRWMIPVGLLIYPFLKRRSWAVYLSVVWLCVYMTWGTLSLTRYSPPPVHIRYFILALPFALIAVAFVAMSLTRSLWSRLHSIRSARIVLVALGAVAGLLVVADAAARVNRLAGQIHHSPEVAGVRYALDYAAESDKRPVVLSYWLSSRMDPVFSDGRYPRVILTKGNTTLGDIQSLAPSGGFLYMDCDYEMRPNHRSPGRASPLDLLVRQSLAGSGTGLIARTLGRFAQFETRLSALRYVLGGSGDDMDLHRTKRAVFLREITDSHAEAHDLSDETAEAIGLLQGGIRGPNWVRNINAGNISPESRGSLICELDGNAVSSSKYGDSCIKTGPFTATRFDVSFQNPDQIAAAHTDFTVGTGTKNRIWWESTPSDDGRLAEGRRTETFPPDQRTGASSKSAARLHSTKRTRPSSGSAWRDRMSARDSASTGSSWSASGRRRRAQPEMGLWKGAGT